MVLVKGYKIKEEMVYDRGYRIQNTKIKEEMVYDRGYRIQNTKIKVKRDRKQDKYTGYKIKVKYTG